MLDTNKCESLSVSLLLLHIETAGQNRMKFEKGIAYTLDSCVGHVSISSPHG